jgi:hypothetical protein
MRADARAASPILLTAMRPRDLPLSPAQAQHNIWTSSRSTPPWPRPPWRPPTCCPAWRRTPARHIPRRHRPHRTSERVPPGRATRVLSRLGRRQRGITRTAGPVPPAWPGCKGLGHLCPLPRSPLSPAGPVGPALFQLKLSWCVVRDLTKPAAATGAAGSIARLEVRSATPRNSADGGSLNPNLPATRRRDDG